MTRNRSDAAPESLGRKDTAEKAGEAPADSAVAAEQVAAYLRQHPAFFDHNPELPDAIPPAGAARPEGVGALRRFIAARLRAELAGRAPPRDARGVTGVPHLPAQRARPPTRPPDI